MSERDQLHAAIEARRELGPDYEPQLVESFLARIEQRLEERQAPLPSRKIDHHAITPIVLGSLGVSIPLIAIAGHDPGLAGIALVCVAIVLVNLIAFFSRR